MSADQEAKAMSIRGKRFFGYAMGEKRERLSRICADEHGFLIRVDLRQRLLLSPRRPWAMAANTRHGAISQDPRACPEGEGSTNTRAFAMC